jgi:hypothetical protein
MNNCRASVKEAAALRVDSKTAQALGISLELLQGPDAGSDVRACVYLLIGALHIMTSALLPLLA